MLLLLFKVIILFAFLRISLGQNEEDYYECQLSLSLWGYNQKCCDGHDKVIIKPVEGVSTVPVYAFGYCQCQFKSVIFAEGITGIGGDSFSQCFQLEHVSFPSTLTYIGISAFVRTNLTSVVFSDGITSIGDGAFAGTPIKSIVLGSVKYIGAYAFNNCKITSLVLPKSVYSVGNVAFAGNPLVSLTIPDETFFLADNSFFMMPQDSSVPSSTLSCINMDFTKPRSIGFQALQVLTPCDTSAANKTPKPTQSPLKMPSKKKKNEKPKKPRKKYSYATHSPSRRPTSYDRM